MYKIQDFYGDLKSKFNVKRKEYTLFWVIVKAFICTFAVREGSLYVMSAEFDVDIPVLNWLFAILKNANGWGMEAAFLLCGCAAVFWICCNDPLQKNRWLNVLAAFFGIWMVIGRSYEEVGTWEYLINTLNGGAQLLLACVVASGYFFAFKNFVVLGIQFAKKFDFKRNISRNKVEKYLFEKYPFRLSLLILIISGLPFLISFFPGALQGDGHLQVWSYLGVIDWDAHHPPISTLLMGKCMEIGLEMFASASVGMFLYTGIQYIVQWFVFAYTVKSLCKLKAPMVLRWGSLLFFAFFPCWQIWGYTLVKDTYYYLCILLFVLQMIIINVEGKGKWSNVLLFIISTIGIVWSRNNGIHVLLLSIVACLFFNKKNWKLYLCSLMCAILAVSFVENIFMPANDISKGSKREMMSIPLQQTARYLKYHMDDVTLEEQMVLESVFSESISGIAEAYNPEVSDPVKILFSYYPTQEEMSAYFRVWFEQFKKHPATYIQAFLNHTYGYFYPDRENFWDPLGFYRWGYDGHWDDGYLQIEFGIEECALRDFYEHSAYVVYQLPLLGMLYSCGLHNYILLACILWLLSRKQGKNVFVLMPGIVTVLVCLVSPVDAFMRYMFPVIVCLPIHIYWCYYCTQEKNENIDVVIGKIH